MTNFRLPALRISNILISAAGRPAFEVIDSLVNAVGAVSMLLDSTHSTVFSLFRSVIGVIDEFSRLRSHFSSLFTAFALMISFFASLTLLPFLLNFFNAFSSQES